MNYLRMALLGLAVFSSINGRSQGNILPETVDELIFVDIKSNNTARAEELIQRGVNVNSRDQGGATLMMWAALKTDIGFVKKLVALGADPRIKGVIYLNEERTGYYGSLMSIAVGENKLELVKYLIEQLKVPIDEKEYEPKSAREIGWNAVEWASNTSNKPILDYLASKGATIDEGILTGGMHQLARQEYDEAIKWTQQMLQLYGNRPLSDSIQATVHYIIGDSYLEMGDYSKAGVELEKAAGFAEACKMIHPFYLMIHSSLAANFRDQGNYEKTLEIYLKVLNNKEALEDKKQKGIWESGSYPAELFQMIANTYKKLKMLDKAEDYYQKALDLSRKTKPSDNIGTARILTDFGYLKLEQKENMKAQEFFNMALTEVKDFEPEEAQKGLVRVYSRMRQFDKAEEALNKLVVLTIAKYGAWSNPHLSILQNDYMLLYYESRNLMKQVPYSATFFRYQLKNLNSMKEPLQENEKLEVSNVYENNFDLSYFLASQSWAKDTTLTSSLYNYHLKVKALLDKAPDKHHGTVHALTWQKKRNSLPKNEADIEIIESPNAERAYPEYYALIVLKSNASPIVVPLYDSTDVTAENFKLYERLSQAAKQDISPQQNWQSVLKKFENVKKIKITFRGSKKPEIKNLYSLVARKHFLDGISAKITESEENGKGGK